MKMNFSMLSMVLCFVIGGHIASAEPNSELGSFEQLTLKLDIPKNNVYPLEPLVFQLSLDKKTAKPIMGAPCLRPFCPDLEVFVAQPGKSMERIERLTWDIADVLVTNYGPIEPGAHFEARWTYDIGLDDYFYEPGVYHLKAVVYGSKGEKPVESPPVVLHVHEPLGVEKLAFEYVRDAYPSNRTRIWFGSNKVEELVLLFPGTAYARHAAFRAGNRAKNKNNWKKAAEYMVGPAEHPDVPLADEALEILELYYSRRDPEKARYYQRTINQRFPHSPYAIEE